MNCCLGCANDCLYCYAAANAARFKRRDRHQWRREEIRLPEWAAENVARAPRYAGRVMFPTAHDLTAGTLDACAATLRALLASGNDVLFVSKADPVLVRWLAIGVGAGEPTWPWLAAHRPELRVSIGSPRESVLRFWEPRAPTYGQRLEALAVAGGFGWPTSVSAEPLLDADHAAELVADVAPLVRADPPGRGGEIWIGKANHLARRAAWARPHTPNLDMNIFYTERHQADDDAAATYDALIALGPEIAAKLRWKDSYRAALIRAGRLPADPRKDPNAKGPHHGDPEP